MYWESIVTIEAKVFFRNEDSTSFGCTLPTSPSPGEMAFSPLRLLLALRWRTEQQQQQHHEDENPYSSHQANLHSHFLKSSGTTDYYTEIIQYGNEYITPKHKQNNMNIMDVGIHLPRPARKVQQDQDERAEMDHNRTVIMARQELCAFERSTKECQGEAWPLVEHAKRLFEETMKQIENGKRNVHHGIWTPEDFDSHMEAFQKSKHDAWTEVVDAAREKKVDVIEAHDKIKAVEKQVLEECGTGAHVAWMGFPTREQHMVRLAYRKQLHRGFQKAKKELDELAGYPEGMLTTVDLLHDHALDEIEKCSKSLHENPTGSILKALPHRHT